MSASSIAPGGPQVHQFGPLRGLPLSDPWDDEDPRPVLRGYLTPNIDEEMLVPNAIGWNSRCHGGDTALRGSGLAG